ncbi:hypothetical protein KR054_006552, partial [Drosophila jambulina]
MTTRTPPSEGPQGREDEGAAGGVSGDSWSISPPRGIPSEIASSVIAAVAQAYETHRAAAESDNVSRTLQEEIRRGFLEMMAMINELVQPLKETAAAVRSLQQQSLRADVGADGGDGDFRRHVAGSATGAYPKAKPEDEELKRSPPKPPSARS